MYRNTILLQGITKASKGMEIAPYHSPLVSKAGGYDVRVLDVFDAPTLKERLLADPLLDDGLVRRIEAVDFVGSATEIASLVPTGEHGTFDYILSSHNLEHLSNPIKFLAGCETLLKSGGLLAMAVPDARSCFDYFRPVTLLGEWLEAWFEDRQKPSSRQVFELHAYHAVLPRKGTDFHSFEKGPSPAKVEIRGDLLKSFNEWKNARPEDGYRDSHCTVMTPNSLRLILEECRMLGLFTLEVESVSAVNGFEFYVRMRKPETPAKMPDQAAMQARRTLLARAAAKDLQPHPLARSARKLIGKAKLWYRKRVAKPG